MSLSPWTGLLAWQLLQSRFSQVPFRPLTSMHTLLSLTRHLVMSREAPCAIRCGRVNSSCPA